MNFFEQQAQARKRSRWLLLMFAIAVLAVVISIDLLLYLVLGISYDQVDAVAPFSQQSIEQNSALLVGGAIACIVVIGLASMYRITSLRSGGGQVAREMGGTLVESDPGDPLRRRLRNVVEEIALASGVPVPEIYVLEREAGINAFAAGYSPSDAAVAVTRGCLEKLSRDELQGVIAHEFSHVLNGDMRLNIRLMGTLFGILLLAIIGRKVLEQTRHVGRASDKNAMAIFAIAFGLMLIGYAGQFFGRWIKSAVSRQREYLADASAVQFTRDNLGIGGALKKIAVYSGGSLLTADTEEIGHMLFGSGRKMTLFATHPPIEQRILRVDPSFRPGELSELRAKLVRQEARQAEKAREERAAAQADQRRNAGAELFLDPARLVEQIGKPGWENMLVAAAVTASISLNVRRAAQSAEWAAAVLFYTVLDRDAGIREEQLLLVATLMDGETESQVRALLDAGGVPESNQRLPLLEMAFPALKRHPLDYVKRVLGALQKLVEADGRIDVFEYLLSRIITQHLWESQNPSAVRMSGRKSLAATRPHAMRLIAILATHGNPDGQRAKDAFNSGTAALGIANAFMPDVGDWSTSLDQDLAMLDRLAPGEKQKLLTALVAVVMKDGKAATVELELLRACCDLMHIPLPMLGRAPR